MTAAHLQRDTVHVLELNQDVQIHNSWWVRATYLVEVDVTDPNNPKPLRIELGKAWDRYGEWLAGSLDALRLGPEVQEQLEQELIICGDPSEKSGQIRVERVCRKARAMACDKPTF